MAENTGRESLGAVDSFTPTVERFHEAAILLLALYTLLWDEQPLDQAVVWAKKMADAVDTDSTWAHGRHEGDCTKVAMSCGRCMMDDFLSQAHAWFEEDYERPDVTHHWRSDV